MHRRFQLKLQITMIVFASVISLAIAFTDYCRLKEQIIRENQFRLQQIENFVKHSLETVEKAYDLFGNELVSSMEAASRKLVEMYRLNPRFEEWDFDALKQQLGFEIYIINEENVITHSSYANDIGMDFDECCRKLAPVLEERRSAGGFYHDGLDLEQFSGEIKKYSYMATDDHKYLIQLGFSLENDQIFQEFQLLRTVDELTARYPSLNEIRILNLGGAALGKSVAQGGVAKERRPYFEEALQTKQTTETAGDWNGQHAIYRYVPYDSLYVEGPAKSKVLEIIYNQDEFQGLLRQHQVRFLVMLLVVLAFTILVSSLISRWVARPMYLAFHDSLTGLFNRAAYEEKIPHLLHQGKGITALLMIDLDDFKLVNDRYGHDAGDRLLKDMAQCIRNAVRKGDLTFRLGGDEFVVVLQDTTREEAEKVADRLAEAIRQLAGRQQMEWSDASISISMGISLAPEHGEDPDILLKRADQALYMAKQEGKNRWRFFSLEQAR
jgi:diguanylate cyclase (GGDEF)-like protein